MRYAKYAIATVLLVLLVAFLVTAVRSKARDFTWMQANTEHSLSGIFALNASHVWAVGNGGVILFYNGQTWSRQESGCADDLNAVCATDPSNAWAVGTSGTVLHFDGTGWRRQASGTTVELTGVSATDAEHVWAVGWSATILCYNRSWKQEHSGTATLRSIFALDQNHIWAVGSSGTVLFHGGKGWGRQNTSTDMELTSVCAVGPARAWAAGLGGVVLAYNGAWRQVMNGPAALYGISADETGRCLAVGYEVRAWSESPGTTVYSFNGHRWTEQQSIEIEYPTGVSTNAGRVWVSGLGGIMYGEPR